MAKSFMTLKTEKHHIGQVNSNTKIINFTYKNVHILLKQDLQYHVFQGIKDGACFSYDFLIKQLHAMIH